jgi:hypothetical protein
VALKHWWGASTTTVWWWRKSLGVKRADPQGSRRLIQAAAEKGAEGMKARWVSEEERAERSRLSKELNLGQNFVTGYHGPRWKQEEIELLGTIPDDEVAVLLGKTWRAVTQKRHKVGIPNPAENHWTAREIRLLGKLPDEEVARRTGRTLNAIAQKRFALGIPTPAKWYWTDKELRLLGTLPDDVVAKRTGRTLTAVTQKRCSLEILNLHDGRRKGTKR